MNSLKLYLCETREDLMTNSEKGRVPSHDCYGGYVIVATSQEEALYNCPGRDKAIRNNHCENLIENGLPVTDEEYEKFVSSVNNDFEYGRMKWSAKSIGLADMSQYKLLDIVIKDYYNA